MVVAECSVELVKWFGPSVLAAVSLIVVVAALMYMIGNLFRKEEYIELSKTELYNIAITLAFSFAALGIIALANEISCSSEEGAPLFDRAINGINRVIYGDAYLVLNDLFKMMLELSALSNLKFTYSAFSFVPFAGLKHFYTSLNIVSFIMESVFASLYLQSMLLVLLKETAMTIIFPAGIFLRTFPILRDSGTFLMALAFSFYVMYPFIYIVSLDGYAAAQQSISLESVSRDFRQSVILSNTPFQKLENSIIWFLTFFSYYGLHDMFLTFGGHIFVGVVVPALATMLSIAMTQSIIRFLREVSS